MYLRKERRKKKKDLLPEVPGVLFVALSNPNNAAALEDCELCCGMKVRAFVADEGELRLAIPIVYKGGSLERAEPSGPRRSTSFPELPLVHTGRSPSAVSPSPPKAAPIPPPASSGQVAPAAPPSGPIPPPIPSGAVPSSTPVAASAPAAPAPAAPAAAPASAAPAAAAASVPAPAAGSAAAQAPAVAAKSEADITLALDDVLGAELDASPEAPSAPPPARALSSRPPPPPRVVVLSGSDAMLTYCREALAPLGGQVDALGVTQASQLSGRERPRLLLVPEEIYPFDRRAFNLLAFQIGVPLVVWSLDMDPADLQSLLLAERVSAPPSSS